MIYNWQAHKDAINWVTWIPELRLIGSSSYDCNVFLWSADEFITIEPRAGEEKDIPKKMGSLVLGNKATAPGQEPDAETQKYRKKWHVQVDKITRYNEEIAEAEALWNDVQDIYSDENYKELKKQKENEARRKQGNGVTDKDRHRTKEAGLVLDKGIKGAQSQQQQHSVQEQHYEDADDDEKQEIDN